MDLVILKQALSAYLMLFQIKDPLGYYTFLSLFGGFQWTITVKIPASRWGKQVKNTS